MKRRHTIDATYFYTDTFGHMHELNTLLKVDTQKNSITKKQRT